MCYGQKCANSNTLGLWLKLEAVNLKKNNKKQANIVLQTLAAFSILSGSMNPLPLPPEEGLTTSLIPKNYIEKGRFLFFSDVKIL